MHGYCEWGQNKNKNISCGDSGYIEIKYANYGRLDQITCSGKSIWRDNCIAEESLNIVANLCSGLQTCEIEASDDIFGDPCPSWAKYLEVRYSCENGNVEYL